MSAAGRLQLVLCGGYLRCSQASWLASIPDKLRDSILDALSPDEALALLHDWPFWARPNQLPPSGSWRIWLLLAGRGFGKTRAGAELIRSRVAARRARRLALVAPTAADARDIMVEGESGILAISPHWDRPRYEPSRRRLIWHNGAIATFYSADEPERLRGPQHDTAWCDELTSWRYPEAWDMLMFGLRLGDDPTSGCHDDTTANAVASSASKRSRGCGDTGHHVPESCQSSA